jgi:FkbM family methyltransferase
MAEALGRFYQLLFPKSLRAQVIEEQKEIEEYQFQNRFRHRTRYQVLVFGQEVNYDISDNYSKHWFLPRYERRIHEPHVTNLFTCFARRSDNILDVGANLGWFTCMSGVVTEGDVHAFEMDIDNAQRLRANIERNDLSNVEICNAAVSNQSGQVSYWKGSEEASPGHSVFKPHTDNQMNVTADAVSLDEYWNRVGTPKVDLVKVDVEGAEAEVVRGGDAMLSQCRPVVFLEVHPSLLPQAEDLQLLSAYFSEADYSYLKIDQFRSSSVALPPLEPVDDSTFPDVSENAMFLLVPEEKRPLAECALSEHRDEPVRIAD